MWIFNFTNSASIPKWLHQCMLPPEVLKEFYLIYSLPTLGIICGWGRWVESDTYKRMYHWHLNLFFWLLMRFFFSYVYWPCPFSPLWNICLWPTFFRQRKKKTFPNKFVGVPYIFWILVFFPLIYGLSFYSLWDVFEQSSWF